MAKKLYEEEDIREIACAIREKCGDETAKYKCCDMPAAIRNLTIGSDPVIEPLTITTNGTYTASTGVDGYSPITVNVVDSGDASMEDALVSGAVTEYTNNRVKSVAASIFSYTGLTYVSFPNATSTGTSSFSSCLKLQTINFPKLQQMGEYCFHNCPKLTTVSLPECTHLWHDCFRGCENLKSVSLPKAQYLFNGCFIHCPNLEEVYCPTVKYIATLAFQSTLSVNGDGTYNITGKLKTIDLPSLELIAHSPFAFQPLTALILRNNVVCKPYFDSVEDWHDIDYPLWETPIAKGEGYIYVPKALIEDYKASALWSRYAAQFRALEDYTVDGTTTGALNEYLI